jgi:hypothetical protein
MRRRTSIGLATTSKPATVALPELASSRVVRILMVVLLPAPLGPSRPKICPRATLRLSRSSAVTWLKRLLRSTVAIAMVLLVAAMIHASTEDGAWPDTARCPPTGPLLPA